MVIPATPETPAEAKARGAFYTPTGLTEYLAGWAVRSGADRVLEPSVGDGAFIPALLSRFTALGAEAPASQVVGVERDAAEAFKVRSLMPGVEVHSADFFDVQPSAIGTIDAVVGNPPYIRYHGFVGSDRDKGLAAARKQGVELNGLASSWAHFVVHSVAFLGPGGRLGLVLPAELLHADYGQPVRDLLLRRFGSVVVIAFDRAVFLNAQVDAVLLMASDDDARGLRVIRVADEGGLRSVDLTTHSDLAGFAPQGRWSGAMDTVAGGIYEAARSSNQGVPLGTLATVDIGFVTGANHFFILTKDEADARELPSAILTPAIRRPGDVPGLRTSGGDVRLLLDLGSSQEPLGPAVAEYIREGEASGVAQRYKCRVRRPWYAVPIPRAWPDAFLPYMTHLGPRLIVNDSMARSSNLLHGVALGRSAPPIHALSAAMSSSLTLLSAEVEGRAYGGGVLKLETKEAERLLVPSLDAGQVGRLTRAFDAIDSHIRAGEIEAAATTADEIIGLNHERLWAAYLTFRDRRLGRHRRRPD